MSKFLIFISGISLLFNTHQLNSGTPIEGSQIIHLEAPQIAKTIGASQAISSGQTIAIFLGYTTQAAGAEKILHNFTEFKQAFGTSPNFGNTTNPAQTEFLLDYALQSFWGNGGAKAQVISVGTYKEEGREKKAAHFSKWLSKLGKAEANSLLILPDAVLLSDKDYRSLSNEILSTSARTGSFALLDVKYEIGESLSNLSQNFRNTISSNHRKEGAAYFPYIKTANSPWMGPSAAVAGQIVKLDVAKGVWKAPANIALTVNSLERNVSEMEQRTLNVDVNAGLSINAIRSFPGRGVLIWGARTLDGNSNEWKYVPVRRLMLMLDKDVANILQKYKKEDNTQMTWLAIKKEVEQLLSHLWRKGAFSGSKAKDAYFVKVGLGETMTAQNVQNGDIILELGVAMTRPAEFIISKHSLKLE